MFKFIENPASNKDKAPFGAEVPHKDKKLEKDLVVSEYLRQKREYMAHSFPIEDRILPYLKEAVAKYPLAETKAKVELESLIETFPEKHYATIRCKDFSPEATKELIGQLSEAGLKPIYVGGDYISIEDEPQVYH